MPHIGYHTLLALMALCNSEKFAIQWFREPKYTSSNLYNNKPSYFPGNHFFIFFFTLGPSLLGVLFCRQNIFFIYINADFFLHRMMQKISYTPTPGTKYIGGI